MIRKPKIAKPTFISHIGPNGGLSAGAVGPDKGKVESKTAPVLEPNLIPGEVPVAQTQTAVKLLPYSETKQGILGALCVTNFKIHFLPLDDLRGTQDIHNRRNKLVGEEDVVLNSVDVVYQVSSGRRKRLTPQSGMSGHVKTLEIHCKDFRIHRFNFKQTPKEECKKVVTAIVHHAFPTRLELLFAFECKGKPATEDCTDIRRFHSVEDWESELKRLKVTGFRTIPLNTEFRHCPSFPETVVVPSTLMTAFVASVAAQFVEYRWPVWSYTYSSGGSLVRQSYLIPESLQKDLDEKMMKAVEVAHPKQEPPKLYDLHKVLPSIREINASYEKIRDMCMPVNLKEVWHSDGSFFSHLDNTNWLSIVRDALKAALRISDVMVNGMSVVIKENDSRDLCPLVASLVQILLDPYFRTLDGFQTLIEKEWVALGHPFNERLGLVSGKEGAQACPTFLLFLDCIWQLLQQFPSVFQFSETYLTSLWDSVCLGLFDSFIFDNAYQRTQSGNRFSMYNNTAPPQSLSVWDWSLQYKAEESALFYNPLYLACKELDLDLTELNKLQKAVGTQLPELSKKMVLRKIYTRMLTETWVAVPESKSEVLRPVVAAPLINIWSHCYLRWVTPFLLIGGGSPAQYLQQCVLVEEISCLKHKLNMMKNSQPFFKASRPRSELIFSPNLAAASSTPSRKLRSTLTSSFPYTPTANFSHLSFLGTPISRFTENSLILDSEEEESCDELECSIDSATNSAGGAAGQNGHTAGAKDSWSSEVSDTGPQVTKNTTQRALDSTDNSLELQSSSSSNEQ